MCKARELRPLAAAGCLATGLLFAIAVVVLFDCADDVLLRWVGKVVFIFDFLRLAPFCSSSDVVSMLVSTLHTYASGSLRKPPTLILDAAR